MACADLVNDYFTPSFPVALQTASLRTNSKAFSKLANLSWLVKTKWNQTVSHLYQPAVLLTSG